MDSQQNSEERQETPLPLVQIKQKFSSRIFRLQNEIYSDFERQWGLTQLSTRQIFTKGSIKKFDDTINQIQKKFLFTDCFGALSDGLGRILGEKDKKKERNTQLKGILSVMTTDLQVGLSGWFQTQLEDIGVQSVNALFEKSDLIETLKEEAKGVYLSNTLDLQRRIEIERQLWVDTVLSEHELDTVERYLKWVSVTQSSDTHSIDFMEQCTRKLIELCRQTVKNVKKEIKDETESLEKINERRKKINEETKKLEKDEPSNYEEQRKERKKGYKEDSRFLKEIDMYPLDHFHSRMISAATRILNTAVKDANDIQKAYLMIKAKWIVHAFFNRAVRRYYTKTYESMKRTCEILGKNQAEKLNHKMKFCQDQMNWHKRTIETCKKHGRQNMEEFVVSLHSIVKEHEDRLQKMVQKRLDRKTDWDWCGRYVVYTPAFYEEKLLLTQEIAFEIKTFDYCRCMYGPYFLNPKEKLGLNVDRDIHVDVSDHDKAVSHFVSLLRERDIALLRLLNHQALDGPCEDGPLLLKNK